MISSPTLHGTSTSSVVRIRHSPVVFVCLFIYLMGAHLRLSIYTGSGAILVPMYLMLIPAVVLGLLFLRPLVRRVGGTFALFMGFALVQPFFGLAPDTGFSLGVLQLLISVASALVLLTALSSLEPERLRRFLLRVWLLLIVLALAESLGLKPLFDAVRDVIYSGSGRFVYFETDRDLAIYNKVRSTTFASEPSFLADSLSTIMLMIFFLDPQRGRLRSYAILAAMVVSSFALSPSFKIVFYLVALMVWQFWPKRLIHAALLLIALAVAILGATAAFEPLGSLFQSLFGTHTVTGSFFGRIVVAPSVAYEALKISPLFGYGIGNDEAVYSVIEQAWVDAGALSQFFWFQGRSATDLMSNGFWWQWIFLGIIGGVIFILFVGRMLHRIGVERPGRTIVSVWIVWYAGFAFIDPHSWFIIVVFGLGAMKSIQPISAQA